MACNHVAHAACVHFVRRDKEVKDLQQKLAAAEADLCACASNRDELDARMMTMYGLLLLIAS